MFFEAFRSKLLDWPFENPRWRPFCIGVGPKTIKHSTDLNDLGVLRYVLKAAGIIACSFVAI